ncbi:MAG: type II toxin-antitoxin system Phd/YefM family antitoxin [Pseudomonadota bacterium]
MQTSIRELKAHLSEYIRQAEAGETVTISIHNRAVAQIVPIRQQPDIGALKGIHGINWNGGKPAGLPRGETMPADMSLADWVAEDRR